MLISSFCSTKTFFESGSSIIESELRGTSSSACSPYSHEEVRCLPQRRVLERLAHTANGPHHVSEFNVACTSAHIPHSMVLPDCAMNWAGDRDGTNALSLSGLELASLFFTAARAHRDSSHSLFRRCSDGVERAKVGRARHGSGNTATGLLDRAGACAHSVSRNLCRARVDTTCSQLAIRWRLSMVISKMRGADRNFSSRMWVVAEAWEPLLLLSPSRAVEAVCE